MRPHTDTGRLSLYSRAQLHAFYEMKNIMPSNLLVPDLGVTRGRSVLLRSDVLATSSAVHHISRLILPFMKGDVGGTWPVRHGAACNQAPVAGLPWREGGVLAHAT